MSEILIVKVEIFRQAERKREIKQRGFLLLMHNSLIRHTNKMEYLEMTCYATFFFRNDSFKARGKAQDEESILQQRFRTMRPTWNESLCGIPRS